MVVSLLKDTLESTPSLSREDTLSEVARMGANLGSISTVPWKHLMLPFTKGHLSNKDRIIWQKGCSY